MYTVSFVDVLLLVLHRQQRQQPQCDTENGEQRDPPLGELYWAIDKQKPQDYYSFGIISEPKASQKPTPKAPPA